MPYATEPKNVPLASAYAFIYTPVSSGRQVENASLETQERICDEYCQRSGWKVCRRTIGCEACRRRIVCATFQ